MSRYSHSFNHPVYGDVIVSYGYDTPLLEFFIMVECDGRKNKDESPDVSGEGGIIFSVSSTSTLNPHPGRPSKFTYSNSELCLLFREFGAMDEHIDLLSKDLPF